PRQLVEEFKARVEVPASGDTNLRALGGSWPTTADPAQPGLSPLSLRPGAQPVPGFRLVSRLGRGGFAEGWRAAGPGEFAVALKFLPLQGAGSGAELRALKAMREIRHPHLISLVASWQVGDHLVVAMELAERTLADHLKEVQDQGLPGIPGDELLRY